MRRTAYCLTLSALLLAAHPAPAPAQLPGLEDGRWLSWIGCWEGAAGTNGAEAGSYLVCFRPLADGSGVEIESHAEGAPTARERIRADGVAAAVEEDGCSGERRAAWSADGRRLFLSSEMGCGAGVTRSTRGTLAVLPEGRGWIEIHEVRAGGGSPLMGIRTFVPVPASALAELGISDPAAGLGLATTTARTQASAPLDPDALAELVERAGASVAGALIVERGEPFALDARTLRALAARGVPGEVLDVMVAMSYPDRFALRGDGASPEAELLRDAPVARPAERSAAPWGGPVRASRGYSPWGFGIYDPYFFDPFYHRGGAYGYGYGAGYGGYPIGYPYYGVPRVIIVEPPVVEERGSVLSRNRGVLPTGGASGGSAAPGAAPTRGGNANPAPPPPASAGSAGSGTSSGSGSSGGDSGGGERRAVPRSGG